MPRVPAELHEQVLAYWRGHSEAWKLSGLAESKAATTKLRGGHESILIVEDNEALRHTAAKQLAKLGYRILEAENGEAALSILRTTKGIDLLFTDIVMAGNLTGRALAREASRLRPDLKILLTTGYAEKASAEANESWQMLRKPYRRQELALKVRDLLDTDKK